MNRRRGIKNIIFSAVSQLVAILAGLVLGKMFMSGYGSATNGLINSVNQVFTYFILLEAGVGLASLQALYLPVSKDDRKSISSIISATKRYYDRTALLYLGAIVIFAAVYSLWIGQTDAGEGISPFTMAGVIAVTGAGNVMNFVYQGKYRVLLQAEGKNYIVTNGQTLLTVLGCVLKVTAMLAGLPIVVVMAFGLAANAAQILYYYIYISRHYSWIDLTAEPASLDQNRPVLAHQFASLVFQNTDVIILTVFCGLKVVSVYAVYKVVVSAVESFTYQLSESLLFILGQGYAKDRDGYREGIDRFDQAYTIVSFTLLSAALLLYLPFVEIYTRSVTDTEYIDRGLPLLFIGIELISSLRRAMQNTISVAGHFRQTVWRSMAETAVNLAVSIALVPFFGIYGVLAGTIAALLYRTNDIIIYSNRRILNRSPLGSYRIYAVNIAAFVPVAVLSRLELIRFDTYVDFLLWGIICVAGCAMWYFAVNMLFFRTRMKELLRLLRRGTGER